MEKYKVDENDLELYASFKERLKDTFQVIIENIKNNIEEYESEIDATKSDIKDNEASRTKCEQEIAKMQKEIASIKDTIENVQSTYKKMVDAYSSTSKGGTKDLYSDIILNAKENCDNEVEKSNSEIASLNADIDAIKNNIVEFNNVISILNDNLESYKIELFRYKKLLDYFSRTTDKISFDINEIAQKKEPAGKTREMRTTKKAETSKSESSNSKKASNQKKKVLNPIGFEQKKKKTEEEEEIVTNDAIEEALNQIYELTGFKKEEEEQIPVEENNKFDFTPIMDMVPQYDAMDQIIEDTPTFDNLNSLDGIPVIEKEDSVVEDLNIESIDPSIEIVDAEKTTEKPVFTDNLESLFKIDSEDIKNVDTEPISFLENEMSSWESILNANSLDSDIENTNAKIEEEISNVDESRGIAINQLLNPYGTTYERLKSLTTDKIVYKDGHEVPFEISENDVSDAINAVDGYDLKQMKIVGPEITLLRKIKDMKEGNL